MSTTIKCNRCGEIIKGASEYDTEVLFTLHNCKGNRDLGEMPTHILKMVATKEITEEEGWNLTDSTYQNIANKKDAVLEILRGGEATAEKIAKVLRSTKKSVQSIVCGLRKEGHDIKTVMGVYFLGNKD